MHSTEIHTGIEVADAGPPIEVALLYLDNERCGRCRETEAHLQAALALAAPVLEALGRHVALRRVHITSEAQAAHEGFVASPTVRIAGRDIAAALEQNACADCGDLCGEDTDCRVWRWRGQAYDAAPVGLILEALLREALGGVEPAENVSAGTGRGTAVPDNLRRFFAARERSRGSGPSCGCGPRCC